MQAKIETLKAKNTNNEEYLVYPRTLIKCVTNENGDSFEDTVIAMVDDAIAANTSISNIIDGTTQVGDSAKLGGQLPDYYADKTYVAEQIAGANHLTREIVTEIPTADTAEDNVIYMYKVDSATGNDVYQEYQLINGEVVLVGDTSVDLSGYATADDLDGYFPLTGGTISGAVTIENPSDSQSAILHMKNSARHMYWQVLSDGRYVLVDNTNGGSKMEFSADGTTNTFNGTASGNLALTGGEVDGNVIAVADDASARYFMVQNSLRRAAFQAMTDGYITLYDNTNGKHILLSSPDGTSNTFYGNATSNLPLAGGVMNGTIQTQALIPKNNNTYNIGGTQNVFTNIYGVSHVLHEGSAEYGRLQISTAGSTSTNGVSTLTLGNATPSGTVGNGYGRFVLYGTNSGYTVLTPGNNSTSSITVTLPSSTGTLALVGHTQAASTITAGTFAGDVIVPASTAYTTAHVANAVLTTTDPGEGASVSYPNGTLIFVYE